MRCDAVLNGVLDEGLQNKIGHLRAEYLGIDVHVDSKAILKTNFLNFEIAVEELKLLFEGHSLVTDVFEGEPKQVAKTC